MKTSIDDGDQAYVEFVRRMLDDLASGRTHTAEHYARLFPACADRIRAEVPTEEPELPQRASSNVTIARTEVQFHDADQEIAGLPERIGRYPVTGELAAGGMGRLLLARHPELDKKLVIKMAKAALAAADSNVLDRLRREATILGRLDHERICPVIDVITEGEQVYVVMPFIEGETLEARINRASTQMREGVAQSAAWSAIGAAVSATPGSAPGPHQPSSSASGAQSGHKVARDARVGLRAILALMEEVARAVHAAHEQDIVHRDLKPGNIMVRADGHPVVLDFGLAVDLSDHQARRLTVQGDLIGTPSYMAPEQIQGEIASIDRRTDVYALGAILYELLTFTRAFKATGVHAIYHRILNGRVKLPRQVNPTIPRDLEAVCLKAMEMEPRRRYATALAFAEDLKRVRTLEATVARPISGFERLVRRIRRNPLTAAAIGGALVFAVIAVVTRQRQTDAVVGQNDAFAALVRLQTAVRQRTTPDARDAQIVRANFPDDVSYELFLAAPDSPEAVNVYLARVETKFRGTEVKPGPVRLLSPRCGIREARPTFRFELGPDYAKQHPKIILMSPEEEIPVRLETQDGALVGVLGPDTQLTPGTKYAWSVELAPAPAGSDRVEFVGSTFWVVPAARHEPALKALKPLGHDSFDALARASVLMSLGLAQEVVDALDKLPPSVTPAEARSALLLRMKAQDALGYKAEAEKLKARYLAALGSAESRPR